MYDLDLVIHICGVVSVFELQVHNLRNLLITWPVRNYDRRDFLTLSVLKQNENHMGKLISY
ncbi:hypothetical protein LguiB_018269 [Lonicera macranthoides]